MLRKNITLLLAVTLWSFGSVVVPKGVSAQTPLSRAVIEALRNQVRLIPKNQSARPARRSETMTPGDALATAKAAMAQLRFNDGSLARLGEQAVFKFTPGTRTFSLSNGTALMLIPPGRGTTRVRTPNAAAGIRGSALFVRYIPETNTTLVGALTTSGIEACNTAGSQCQELKAGNMAVLVKDRLERVYEFDLNTFYQTSELAAGLNLTKSEATPSPDEAIAAVQAETSEALKAQSSIVGAQVIENPSFVQLSASTSADFPDINRPVIEGTTSSNSQNPNLPRNNADVRSVLEGGEIRNSRLSNQIPNQPGSGGNFPGGGNTGGNFPGGGNTGGNFPGGGNTGGNFPGGGNTGGNFPGGGNTGGNSSGGGNTGGNSAGGGNTGGNSAGGGNTGGNSAGGGNTGGNSSGGGNTGGNSSGGGNTGGNSAGGGNTGGNSAGGGNTGGNFPGGGNTGGNFPGGGNTGGNFPGGGNTGGNFPGGGNTGGNFPGGGNTGGNFPGGGNSGGNFPGGGNSGGNSSGGGNSGGSSSGGGNSGGSFFGRGNNNSNQGSNLTINSSASIGNNNSSGNTSSLTNVLPSVSGNVSATVNTPTITP